MNKLKIKIILGSIRNGRFGDKPAKWIYDIASKSKEIEYEILDLKNYTLPQFDEVMPPSYVEGDYSTPEVNEWAKKIAEADGFIIISPEYNHSFSSVLKNNIDHIFKEWNNKPVAFVSYGSVGGARAVEQLRLVACELQMAPIRNAVHIVAPWFLVEKDNSLKAGALDPYVGAADKLIEQLTWWTKALKNARDIK